MDVKLKAKRPFTDWVANRGMVVFNEGEIDSLPTDIAERRIEAGFADRVKAEPAKERAVSEQEPPRPVTPQPVPVESQTPRRGRPPKPSTDAPAE